MQAKLGWGLLQETSRKFPEDELLRTPFSRTSENAASRHLGEVLSTAPHPPKPGHIAQTLNARGFSYATCCTLQPLVARQCRVRGFRIESTADKAPNTNIGGALCFYGFCRQNREPTSGLEPLIPLLQLQVCGQW